MHNFQDTILLCEIFEERSAHLQKIFTFKPKRCNWASSFSGCVHRDKGKCLIGHPTDAEQVKLVETGLAGLLDWT